MREVLGDLHAQLARGGQHQGLNLALLHIDAFQQGNAEGGGFSGAGLRQRHHVVFAGEQVRDGPFLHGSGLFEAKFAKGTQDLCPDAERFESGHGDGKAGMAATGT